MLIKCSLLFYISATLTASFCDPVSSRMNEVTAYKIAGNRKRLGEGAFGEVSSLEVDGKIYAVKQIDISRNKNLESELAKLPKDQNDTFVEFKTEVEALYQDNGIKASDIKTPKFQKIIKRFNSIQDLTNKFLKNLISHEESLRDEVNMSKLISEKSKAIQKDGFMNFHFCTRLSGFTYLIFGDLYGQSLKSEDSKSYLKNTSIQQRFKLYLEVAIKVLYLQSFGLAHCDLKLDNILWRKNAGDAVVLADYGLVTNGGECFGGTKGYIPPEYYTESEELKKNKAAFKFDVYSLGAMIATMEMTTIDSELNFSIKQYELEKDNKYLENFDGLIEDLRNLVRWEKYVLIFENKSKRANYEHFFGDLETLLVKMTAREYKDRIRIDNAVARLWCLYQFSKNLDMEISEYITNKKLIREYVNNFIDEKRQITEIMPEFDLKKYKASRGKLI
jgi:serine/threonine protein kinase